MLRTVDRGTFPAHGGLISRPDPQRPYPAPPLRRGAQWLALPRRSDQRMNCRASSQRYLHLPGTKWIGWAATTSHLCPATRAQRDASLQDLVALSTLPSPGLISRHRFESSSGVAPVIGTLRESHLGVLRVPRSRRPRSEPWHPGYSGRLSRMVGGLRRRICRCRAV